MFSFTLLFLWLHLLAAIVWIGGIVFTAFVAGPLFDAAASPFAVRLVRRFQRLSRELLYVMLVTGVFNLMFRGALIEFNFSTRYLTFVGVKFTLLLVIAALQVYYSVKLIPRVLDTADESPGRLRRRAWWIAAGMTGAGAAAVYLGLSLRYV